MRLQQNASRGLALAQTTWQGRPTELAGGWARYEQRIRDAFLGMVAGLVRRPEPRHLFDNVAGDRAWPWRACCTAMRAAARAGAPKDQVMAFADELHGFALALYPVRFGPDVVAALLAEADADSAADPIQARAIAHADRVTLERVILTAEIHIDRLEQLIVAARARLCGPIAASPSMQLVR